MDWTLVNPKGLPPSFVLLVNGYFHQDWDLNGPNARAVLERFASQEPLDDVIGARDAASRLAGSGLSESELSAHLHELGLGYGPSVDGLDHLQWLDLVVETLTTWLASRGGRSV